jgi:hypothetical protein
MVVVGLLHEARVAVCLRVHHPESGVQVPKLTADHEYPRKIAAADLLMRHTGESANLRDELLPLYVNKYGRFNYITPHENRSLMRHQRRGAFKDPATAYMNANISKARYSDEKRISQSTFHQKRVKT